MTRSDLLTGQTSFWGCNSDFLKMTNLEVKIINLISENLGVAKEEVAPESSFRKDLGIETLTINDLLAKIQEEFNIDLEEAETEKVKTVRQLINLVTSEIE